MSARLISPQKRLVFVAVIAALLIVSCTRETDPLPRVWIDSPRDGLVLESGQTVEVYSHAYALAGLAEVVLSVNGEAYQRTSPAEEADDFSDFQQAWQPPGDGRYILQLVAYDREGNKSNPATIVVTVGMTALPEEAAEVPEEEGDEQAEICPPAAEVISPANCRSGPGDVYPVVSTFTAGTELDVQGQGEGGFWYVVNQPGSSQGCWIWEELVELSSAGCSLTVIDAPPTPQPPEDLTPPPAPQLAVPANGLSLDCRSSQNLAWVPVEDDSGIAGYYLKVEKELSPGSWQSAGGWGPIQGKQQSIPVDCGVKYRWTVRAEDGAGNFGSWSGFATFIVELE